MELSQKFTLSSNSIHIMTKMNKLKRVWRVIEHFLVSMALKGNDDFIVFLEILLKTGMKHTKKREVFCFRVTEQHEIGASEKKKREKKCDSSA